jgi:hypothetical protein
MGDCENEDFELFLNGLYDQYESTTTDALKVKNALVKKKIVGNQSEIINDHLAFRSFQIKGLGIDNLEKVFLKFGYIKKDKYHFKNKKLDAYWYSPPIPKYPRIFISELIVDDLSPSVRDLICKHVEKANIPEISLLNSSKSLLDVFIKKYWDEIDYNIYKSIAEESEYAAWVLQNGFALNHYTISIHNLKSPYNCIKNFMSFLKEIGIVLNDSGSIIKESNDKLLLQCSSISKLIDTKFLNGFLKKVSGSYVEFAERKVLPQFKELQPNEILEKHRKDGFETASADKIFESSYLNQTQK